MKLILALLVLTIQCFAYVYTITASGAKLRWSSRTNYIEVASSYSNQQGLSSLDIESIVDSSIQSWNNIGQMQILETNENINVAGNRIYFSSNPSFFGSGVLGVTAMSYSESSGQIFSADIILNDTGLVDFSTSPSASSSSTPYLGDVITHEFGHLLGLNHSEVVGATMVYNVFKGQHLVGYETNDDIAGVRSLYEDNYSSSANWIRGKVVGEGQVPVFGANVQLIDASTNKVIAGVVSEENGDFVFEGVLTLGTYYILVSPMKSKENISEFYRNVRASYCNGNDFQPSFYSRCGTRDLGVPQYIEYNGYSDTSVSYDVGLVTVRCSTPVNPEYLRTKFSSDTNDYFTAFDYAMRGKAYSGFTGYFTNTQVDEGLATTPDKIKIDLSNLDINPSVTTFLEIRKLTTSLGSSFATQVAYKFENSGSFSYSNPSTGLYGKVETDNTISIPLSTIEADNIIDLEILPIELDSDEKSEIFGNVSELGNKNQIYHLSFQVVEFSSGSYQDYDSYDDYPYLDNASCLEGNVGEPSGGFRSLSNITVSDEDAALGCGTIDIDSSNGPGGMGSLLMGLFILLFAGFALQKTNEYFV
jgi:hypothetical protein